MHLLSVFLAIPLLSLFDVDPSDALGSLMAAVGDFRSGFWIPGVALVVGGVVAFTKQGWLSTWLATRIPSKLLPWMALALSAAATWSLEVTQGVGWSVALVDAVKIAAVAVLGHQTVVEGFRGGKEIVPVAPWSKGKSGGSLKPPPRVAGVVFLLLGAVGAAGLAATQTGCTAAQGREVNTVVNAVLNDEQVACVVLQSVLPLPQIMSVCKLTDDLMPLVQTLVNGLTKARSQMGAHGVPACVPGPVTVRDRPQRQRTASLWSRPAAAY